MLIAQIGLFVSLSVIIWCVFGMAYNNRAMTIYKEKIDRPWRAALDRNDFVECDHWHKQADAFPLHSYAYVFNPYRWFENWNWSPEPFKG